MTTSKFDARNLMVGFAILAATSAAHAAPEFAPGEILFKPAKGLSEAKIEKIMLNSNGRAMRGLRGLDVRLMKVPEGQESRIAEALSRNPHVAFSELNYKVPAVATVNDPDFGRQWHLSKMQAPAAWDTSDGSGVTVAVLDSGVYAAHPDLAGQLVNGWNVLSNSTDTPDATGHGTKVAGTVAAAANNLTGGASTAPGAKIMPIRITNDGWAYFSDMAEGVTWAADHGARVANISFSGAAGSSTLASAGAYMMNKGGVLVVAAGNDNTDYGYSNSPYIFVASATDGNDAKASWSSYGNFVDAAAPGVGIYTTNSSGTYSSVSGTSFSSPNTAAVAALVMAANPSLTPTDVTAILSNTAVDLGTSGWDPYYGHGRVDALAAVQMAANVSTSDRTAPDVAVASPGSGQTVSAQVSISVQASDDFGVTRVDLLVDGRQIASETQGLDGVYLFSWDSTGVSDGQHRISARAVDAAGNSGSASDVTVTVSNIADSTPPTARIDSPRDGDTVSGNVSLSGLGQDDQGVAQFKLMVDGKLKCTGTTSAACSWNTRKESEGTHTISAEAIDHAGNVGTASISVTLGSTSSDSTSSDTSGPPVGKGWRK